MKYAAVSALVFSLGLVTLASAQTLVASASPEQNVNAKPAPASVTTPEPSLPKTSAVFEPEYSGVIYAMQGGKLSALPHIAPKVKSKFKTSLVIPAAVSPVEIGRGQTLIIKIEGSGDPSQFVQMAAIEDGKVQLNNDSMSSFAKTVQVTFTNLGNRTFEFKPSTAIPDGNYAIALKSDNPFSVPECFLFRVAGTK